MTQTKSGGLDDTRREDEVLTLDDMTDVSEKTAQGADDREEKALHAGQDDGAATTGVQNTTPAADEPPDGGYGWVVSSSIYNMKKSH